MKRRTVKALVCTALMALSLSVTACGGSGDAASGADAATEEAAPAEEETPAEEAAPAEEETPAEEAAPAEEETPAEEAPAEEETPDAEAGSGETLEDYMNAVPDAKKQIEDEIASAEQQGMSVAVDIKGNDMIFTYTYEDASQITDDTPAQLDAVTEAMGSVYEMMAEQMDQAMGVEKTVSIVVRYLDPDGNVLSESSFKAQ